MVQANQLVMLDGFQVSSRIPRKVIQEMRLGVHPKQLARVSLIVIPTTRPDEFLGHKVRRVTAPG